MNLQLTIMLEEGEDASNLPGDAVQIAHDVLIAAGGDPETDNSSVSIIFQSSGTVGPSAPPDIPETP